MKLAGRKINLIAELVLVKTMIKVYEDLRTENKLNGKGYKELYRLYAEVKRIDKRITEDRKLFWDKMIAYQTYCIENKIFAE